MFPQKVLITDAVLSKDQREDLSQWWKNNYSWVLRRGNGALLTIPLANHFVNFRIRHIGI